ncbi:MAG TPA: hypothetical protein DCR74_14695 [Achromobacter sp.]|nr:hypothetical protein [Achromobacter sp.]
MVHNAHDYENAVLQCIGGLVHSKDGIQVLSNLISLAVDKSPYWLALANGSDLLLARLKSSSGEIAKNIFSVMDKFLEEHKLTAASNALIGLLQAVPEPKVADVLMPRLRHVMEVRAGFTIVRYDIDLGDLQRAAFELQGYQALGEDELRGWKMPSPRIKPADVDKRTSVYDWVKVGETTYRELDEAQTDKPVLPPSRAVRMEGNPFISMLNRLRTPVGHLFTGLGGLLALNAFSNAWKGLRNSDEIAANYVRIFGATSAVVAAGVEISSSVIGFGAMRQGNSALALRMSVIAAKRGVAVFGAGAAGLAAVADLIKAIRAFIDSNPEQAGMLVGSAIAGGIINVAMWAGGTATAAALVGGGTAIVLGLNPAGWAIAAGIAGVFSVGFAFGVDITKHGPVELWLKHSAWGVEDRHYSNAEELEAVHSILYRPRLTTEWTNASGYTVGALRISCQLPDNSDISGTDFSRDYL